MIRFACSICNAPLTAPDDHAGLTLECASCGHPVLVPPAEWEGGVADEPAAEYRPRRPLWPRVRMVFIVVLFFGAAGGIGYAGWRWRETRLKSQSTPPVAAATTKPTPPATTAATQPEPPAKTDGPPADGVRSRWDLPDLKLPPSELRPVAGQTITAAGRVVAHSAKEVVVRWQGYRVVCPVAAKQQAWAAKRRDGEAVAVRGKVERIDGTAIHLGEWEPTDSGGEP